MTHALCRKCLLLRILCEALGYLSVYKKPGKELKRRPLTKRLVELVSKVVRRHKTVIPCDL